MTPVGSLRRATLVSLLLAGVALTGCGGGGAKTYAETVGGAGAHTWSDAADAGGTPGTYIVTGQTVGIACAEHGDRVADGNTWWYRIASKPWDGHFYVSADAFYNNGHTTGGLKGTPYVDPKVGRC